MIGSNAGRHRGMTGKEHNAAVFAVMNFFKSNVVFTAALSAAVITSLIVPPDAEYLGYFDFKTLTCLFSTLAVVCALRSVNFFSVLADGIIKKFSTLRSSFLALLYITFIGSMFIANDMALLTFLPLGYYVVERTGNRRYMAFLFVMQNISANLGGMLTPFGNPQNLYLYSFFNIPTIEFMKIMLLPFAAAVTIMTLCCMFIPKEPVLLDGNPERIKSKTRRNIYLALFMLSVVMVFRLIPYAAGLVIITVALLFLDRNALKQVDYPLLLTFAAFFVFSGNMARIPGVRALFSSLLERNTLLFSILSCQCISNVPSAILLSQFTDNYADLLRGVNIGGTGTLIASLASLITFREYQKNSRGKTGKYMLVFTGLNLLFLVSLTLLCLFI